MYNLIIKASEAFTESQHNFTITAMSKLQIRKVIFVV